VIKEKLNKLLEAIQQKAGDIVGRGFVDSAPVLERTWAQKSGAGWIGKNGNLISKTDGSFFFIATLIVDLPLVYDDPFAKDYCGSCTKCIDACPTDAILPDKTIAGNKCISYFTIELKDAIIPSDMKGKFDNWMLVVILVRTYVHGTVLANNTRSPDLRPTQPLKPLEQMNGTT